MRIFALLLLIFRPQVSWSSTFRVRDYGAIGDGKHNDTAAITAALDAAAASPGSLVLLDAPGIFLSGSQYMRSHTTFRVETGATLLGSAIYSDYPFAPHPGVVHPDNTLPPSAPPRSLQRESLIAGARCQEMNDTICMRWGALVNVTLDGGGVIDGQGAAWWWANDAGSPAAHQRPDMIQPYLVDGLTIKDLTFQNSPAWTLHPALCTGVLISNIQVHSGQFDNAPQYSGHNVDGIDPDSCQDVLIENSRVHAGDDCIAIYSVHGPTRNVTVRNVTCHTPMSITHGGGGTSDVLFDSCIVRGDWGADLTQFKPKWWKTALRIKTDRHTNGTVQNVMYRNIVAVGVDLLFDIQSWYPCQNQSGTDNYLACRSYYPVKPGVRPHIRNITIVNSVARNAWRSVWLNCLPESPCEGVWFRNVSAPGAHPMVCENVKGGAKNSVLEGHETCFEP